MDMEEAVSIIATANIGLEFNEFRPYAYYDQYMDCIRVSVEDVTTVEERCDEFITLHRAAKLEGSVANDRYIGFTLKGIRHLFADINLSLEGAHKLSLILDKLVLAKPHTVLSRIVRLVKDIESFRDATNELEVDFNEVDLAA